MDEKIGKKDQQDPAVEEVESEAVWKKSGIGRRWKAGWCFKEDNAPLYFAIP